MADALEGLLDDASRIPAAPGVALELARSCEDADVTIEHLVNILQCDPGLTAKVLRMANSAYFASRREIGDLSEAVVRLGLRRVQVMALAFCVMEATSGNTKRGHGFDYNYFWNHALITATFADVTATARRLHAAPEALVAGLLQDIGVLIIQTNMPGDYREVLDAQARGDEELHVVESRRLGFNHMQAGELMLRRWHIPEIVCRVVGNHHQSRALSGTAGGMYELAAACQVGAAMAKFLTGSANRPKLLSQAAHLAQDLLSMPGEQLQSLLGLVRMRLEASAEMLEVRLDETMTRRLDAAIRDRIAESVMELTDLAGPGK